MLGPQKSFVALVALMGAFLIPIMSSSLKGLSHLLTCRGEVESPFTMIVPADGPPQVLSSTRVSRGGSKGLCGGLEVDLRARGEERGRVQLEVFITNRTDSPWRGTVQMTIEGGRTTRVPVDIGKVEAGKTASDTISLTLPSGTHELEGSLLLGP